MTDVHMQRINTCYKALVVTMAVYPVLNYLYDVGCLTQWEIDEIRHLSERSKMARALLDILLRKSDRAFNMFVKALQSTAQGHLAHLLLREGEYSLVIILCLLCLSNEMLPVADKVNYTN